MEYFAFVLIIVFGISHYFDHVASTGCVHAPDAEEQKAKLRKEAFQDYLLGRWTFKNIQEYRKNTAPDVPQNMLDIKSKQVRISGEPSCRKNRRIARDSDISAKSTCPWYMVLDVDTHRQPQIMTKAKCSCKRCLSVDRTGKTKDRCTEVNSFVPVVKWRCPNNYSKETTTYFEYFVDIETVPVGCTCRRPVQL